MVLIDWWSWRRSWQRSSGLRTASGLNKTGNVIDLYKVLVSFLEVAGSSTVLSVFYDITPIERSPVPLVVAFRIKIELKVPEVPENPVGTTERDVLAKASGIIRSERKLQPGLIQKLICHFKSPELTVNLPSTQVMSQKLVF